MTLLTVPSITVSPEQEFSACDELPLAFVFWRPFKSQFRVRYWPSAGDPAVEAAEQREEVVEALEEEAAGLGPVVVAEVERWLVLPPVG